MNQASMRPDQMLVTVQGVRGGKTHTNKQGSCRIIVKKGFNEPENYIWVDVFSGRGAEYKAAANATISISFKDGTEWNGSFEDLQKKLK
jgi:hypothetical protein